jgi:hypothetical protein
VPTPAISSGLFVVALATAGLGGPVLVARLGDSIARTLGAAAASLPEPAPAPTDTGSDTSTDVATEPLASGPDAGGGGDRTRTPPPSKPAGSIDIPADRLARLTAKQLEGVQATDAVDAAGHPVGARLHAVGGLGVGLTDGDVVTSIDGRATANADDATTAALGAYMSGESTVHATLLRAGRTLRVTVHVPAR